MEKMRERWELKRGLGRAKSSALSLSPNARGDDSVPSTEKTLPHKPKKGETEEPPRGGETPPKMMETPPFPGIHRHPGDQATCPQEGTLGSPPLAELGGGARSFGGDTMGCCVGRAWRGRAAAEGRVALGEPVSRRAY